MLLCGLPRLSLPSPRPTHRASVLQTAMSSGHTDMRHTPCRARPVPLRRSAAQRCVAGGKRCLDGRQVTAGGRTPGGPAAHPTALWRASNHGHASPLYSTTAILPATRRCASPLPERLPAVPIAPCGRGAAVRQRPSRALRAAGGRGIRGVVEYGDTTRQACYANVVQPLVRAACHPLHRRGTPSSKGVGLKPNANAVHVVGGAVKRLLLPSCSGPMGKWRALEHW
jgi:hypothetical protein